MKVSAFFGLIAFAPLLSCVAEDADRLVQQESSLTAEDCDVGTLLGKVGVCHYDVVKGYVYLRLATKACQHGHALHDLDFASDDPACIPPQPTCESGSDSDCPAGMYCETASGDCIQSLACKLTSDCDAGMVCDSRYTCIPDPICFSDQNCALGSYCNVSTGDCVASAICKYNSDCGAGWQCEPARGTCIPEPPPGGACSVDWDCLSGMYCDEGGHCSTSATCNADTDCNDDFVCDSRSTCVPTTPEPPCASDNDCGWGSFCDEPSGACVPSWTCYSSVDCGPGWLCDPRATCIPE